MHLTVTFPSENHRKRGHAHYEAIYEAEKTTTLSRMQGEN